MTRFICRALIALTVFLLSPASLLYAEETQYREFTPASTKPEIFDIAFDDKVIEITLYKDSAQPTERFKLDDRRVRNNVVYFGTQEVFNDNGLRVANEEYAWNDVYDTRITTRGGLTVISFFAPPEPSQRLYAVKRGNVVSFSQDITIEKGQFIRGVVFSVLGNITVDGEVNRDVISLFGNVQIGPEAVARGDVASITGNVEIARHAGVYGETYTAAGVKAGRRGRFYRANKANELTAGFLYNRVDGAHPWVGYHFDDGDSLLPRVNLSAGYAFASQRSRFEINLEQTVSRRMPLSIGASVYRKLASGDDWLLGDAENTVYALVAREDFKDYYEADGGILYARSHPVPDLTLEMGYRYEQTNWLNAHRHLWSLFGGDKLFRPNFSRVDSAYRAFSIDEIDTTANASLVFSAKYSTRDFDEPYAASSWIVAGSLEWSHHDINSDFNYRRYSLSVSRYQKLNRYTMIIGRAMYAGSDGYMPMYKRFFLGGLGTLQGYYQKEYMGTHFWMTNLEYRFQFPNQFLALSLLYDVGQIADDAPLDERADVKQSLGLALYLGNDVRISLAKRLDRSYDDTPKFYVRLGHTF